MGSGTGLTGRLWHGERIMHCCFCHCYCWVKIGGIEIPWRKQFPPLCEGIDTDGSYVFAGLIGMDSVPVGRYIPSGCVSRADVQCLVILGSSACGLGIRATPAEEMFLFHGSYVHRGMDRPKTSAWVDDRGP